MNPKSTFQIPKHKYRKSPKKKHLSWIKSFQWKKSKRWERWWAFFSCHLSIFGVPRLLAVAIFSFSLLGPSLNNGKLKRFIVRKMGERVGFCTEDDLFIFYFFSFSVLCLALVAEVDRFGVWYGPFPINVFLLKRFDHCLRPGNAL